MENIKPLRILFISIRSDMGGGPKHMLQLVSNISPIPNFQVYVAAPMGDVFSQEFKKHAEHFIDIPHRSFSFKKFLKILLFCRENNINIIHSHGRGAGIYSRLLALFGFKVIHSFHGIHEEPGKLGKIKLVIDQLLGPLTTYFISATKRETRKAIDCKLGTKENIQTIPNGINMEVLKNHQDLQFKVKHKIPTSKKVWGYLSRISYQKGVDLFINYMKDSNDLDDFFFIIAGDGEDLEYLRREIEDNNITNLLLIGQIDSPYDFLHCLDGYFSFSRGEGLPLSVLEAIACNLPCVLSNVTGHDQFGEEMMYFDLTDFNEFISHIKNPKLPSYKRLKDEYGESKMISRTIEVYRSAHPL